MIRGVPYDAEVEYLESTGTQWIVLGENLTNFKIEFIPSDYRRYGAVIGVQNETSPYRPCQLRQDADINSARLALCDDIWISVSISSNQYNTLELEKTGVKYRLFLNGNQVKSSTGSITSKPYYLFSANQGNNGASFMNGTYRVKSCSYTGLDGLHNLVPVRFTNEHGVSEGAMYDRVSRKLFRNGGTGAFSYGPDVATPVMGLHFMRRGGGASMTAKDYIQDGLVALFDATENKGWGVYDPSAKSWVDLTGNEQALSFSSSGSVKCDGKSMKCTGWAYNTAKSRSYLNGLTVEWISPGDLYDRMRPYNDLAAYSFPQTYLLRFGVFGMGPSDTRFDGIRTAVSGARSATMAVEPGGCTLYINDKGKSYHVNKAFTKLYGSARIQIGQIANTANTQAHCFRLYNRALTAEEIIHNHAIDVERFGIPWGGQ